MKNSFFVLILFSALTTRSQISDKCDSTLWAKPGTYDIVPLSKVNEVFTTDLLCIIEANRKDNESVDLQISPLTIIRIHPRKNQKNKSSKK